MVRPRVLPQLTVVPEKGAGLGGAGAGFGVHVLAGGAEDLGSGDEAAAEGAGEDGDGAAVGQGGPDGLAVLVEAVGVAAAGVAEERAAALVVGGAEEEDGVVRVVHAHRAADLVELLGVGGGRGIGRCRVRVLGERGGAIEGDGSASSFFGHFFLLIRGGGGGETLDLI